MHEWFLSLTKDAEEDFRKLDEADKGRIFRKMERLCKNYDAITPLPLTGPWQGFFKIRAGEADYLSRGLCRPCAHRIRRWPPGQNL